MQIIYLKTKTPISIGDKIKIDNVTITITQEFIDDNKDMFEVVEETRYWKCLLNCGNSFTLGKIYKLGDGKNFEDNLAFIDNEGKLNGWGGLNHTSFTPSTEQEYLLQIAKEKYPVGTIFRDLDHNHRRTINNTNKYDYNVLANKLYHDSICIFSNNKWAEILKPILTTEDGKELYEGDRYWFTDTVIDKNSVVASLKANTLTKHLPCYVRFSTKEACQEYIDKHKEKTLEDYEFKFSMQYNNLGIAKFVAVDFIQEMKGLYPELYWHKIALLIRDDLNGNSVFTKKYIIYKDDNGRLCFDWTYATQSTIYFKSSEARDKFMELMGDRINYLF